MSDKAAQRDRTVLSKTSKRNNQTAPAASADPIAPVASAAPIASVASADPIAVSQTVIGDDGLARPPWAAVDPMLREYYDTEWGMPVRDEQGLFERLCLEGFQAGLSWATILRKRPAFREAFDDFDPDRVAAFDEQKVEQLMLNTGIVRNGQKIRAMINNANATIELRQSEGLVDFVWSFRPATTPRPTTVSEIPTSSPESAELSKQLRKRGFKFVGPTSMYALMEAIGMVDTHLVDSHRRDTSGVWV